MATDLLTAGVELKVYTVGLLDNIEEEVKKQFDKWCAPVTGYVPNLMTAFTDAQNAQTKVLSEQEDEARRAYQRSLFILNFLAIGATAWLGVWLEKVAGPSLFFEYGHFSALPPHWVGRTVKEFEGSFFANFGKDVANALMGALNERLAQPSEIAAPNANKVAHSPNMDRFGGNLYDEITKQKDAIINVILSVKEEVNRSNTFSTSIAEALMKVHPHLEREPYSRIIEIGQNWIKSLIEPRRQAWAASNYFYGFDPPSPDWRRIGRQLEKMIWAIWILQQGFQPQLRGSYGSYNYYLIGAQGDLLGQTGGFGSTIKDSPITLKLFEDFDAPVQSLILRRQGTRYDYEDYGDCAEQAGKLQKWALSIDTNEVRTLLKGIRRPLGAIDHMFGDTRH